jgi:hypothetical protein
MRRTPRDGQDEREAAMLGSVKALLVCGALIAGGLGAAAPAAASAAVSASDTCMPTISDITANGQSVTFTGHVECNYSTTSIELHTVLYFCGSLQPEASKIWLAGNCSTHTNMQTYAPEEAGVTYTLSDTGNAQTGYYVSELNYLIGGSNHGPNYGTPAHCSVGSLGTATCTNVEFAG